MSESRNTRTSFKPTQPSTREISGGALVNLRGELIGINTAFIGATNTNPGMGFAIPINMVWFIADQLLKYGEVRRGRPGIIFDQPTLTLIRSMKLLPSTTGPVIVKVEKDRRRKVPV